VSLTNVDIVLIVMGVVMVVSTALLLAYFLHKPESSPEENIPLRIRPAGTYTTVAGSALGNEQQAPADVEAPTDPKKTVEQIFLEGGIMLHTSKGPRNVSVLIPVYFVERYAWHR
jgi:hypothetical protein